jgi:hypothetical protein
MRTFPWPPDETGPCGSCGEPHRRYGPEGGTLCPSCRPQAEPRISSPEAPSGPKAVTAARPAPEFDQPELFA